MNDARLNERPARSKPAPVTFQLAAQLVDWLVGNLNQLLPCAKTSAIDFKSSQNQLMAANETYAAN